MHTVRRVHHQPVDYDGVPIAEKRRESARRKEAVWRGKLTRLSKMRHGNHFLPDNAEGRAMLMALLRCKLSVDDAMEVAPWLQTAELRKLQRAARKLEWHKLGALIGLTYAEREAAKLWFLMPCDVTWEEVQRLQAVKNRANARKRQDRKRQKEREGLEIMKQTDVREQAVERMLELAALPPRGRGPTIPPRTGWTSVAEMVKQASTCRAFLRPDGRPLRNLRDAVHSTLKVLTARGAVEIRMQNGARGPVCLVRLTDLKNAERDTFSDRRSVGRRNDASKGPKPTVTQGLRGDSPAQKNLSHYAKDRRRTPISDTTSPSTAAPTVEQAEAPTSDSAWTLH